MNESEIPASSTTKMKRMKDYLSRSFIKKQSLDSSSSDDLREALIDNNTTNTTNEGDESSSQSFLSFFWNTKGPMQIFFMSLLFAFSIGSTIAVVPAVITDRYARINHGFTGDKSCSEYGQDEKPLPCIDGSADAQTATVLVSTISNIATFLSSALIGSLSDQYGRRIIILLGILLCMMHHFTLVLIQLDDSFSPNWYFASDILSNFISWFTISLSSVSDVTPKKWRAASFGMLTATFSVGFSTSPSLALTMTHFHTSIFSFFLLFLCLLYAFLFLPETLPKETSLASRQQRQLQRNSDDDSYCKCICRNLMTPFRELSILNRNSFIRTVGLLAFFSGMSSSGDRMLLIYYAEDRIGFKDKDIASLFMIMGIGDIIALGCLLKLLNDWIGEKYVIIVSFIAGLIHNTIYAFANSKIWIFVGILVGVLDGLSFPTISAMKSNNVDKCEQGQIQGALSSLSSLASALGPATMRLVYQATIHSDYPGAFFLVGSVFFLIATICAFTLPSDLANSKNSPQPAEESFDSIENPTSLSTSDTTDGSKSSTIFV